MQRDGDHEAGGDGHANGARPALVEVTPSKELVFHPPFTAGRNVKVTLRNLTHDRVAFKVKTTAPKLFLVRPNSGILPPMAEIEASVILQPQTSADAGMNKSKDKFLIQTAVAPATDVDASLTPASIVDMAIKDNAVSEVRLRAVYLSETGPESPVGEPIAAPEPAKGAVPVTEPAEAVVPTAAAPKLAPADVPAAVVPVVEAPVPAETSATVQVVPTVPVAAKATEEQGVRQRSGVNVVGAAAPGPVAPSGTPPSAIPSAASAAPARNASSTGLATAPSVGGGLTNAPAAALDRKALAPASSSSSRIGTKKPTPPAGGVSVQLLVLLVLVAFVLGFQLRAILALL